MAYHDLYKIGVHLPMALLRKSHHVRYDPDCEGLYLIRVLYNYFLRLLFMFFDIANLFFKMRGLGSSPMITNFLPDKLSQNSNGYDST